LRASQQRCGGPVPAQRAHLRIDQVSVGAFGVTAVSKAHELDFRVDPGGGFDLGYMPKEVPLFPRQSEGFDPHQSRRGSTAQNACHRLTPQVSSPCIEVSS